MQWGGSGTTSPEVEVTDTMYSVGVVCNDTSITILRPGLIRAESTVFVSRVAMLSLDIEQSIHATVQVGGGGGISDASLVYYREIQWHTLTTPVLETGAPLSQEGQSHTVLGVGPSGALVQLSTLWSSHPLSYDIQIPSITGRTPLENGYAWTGHVPINAIRVACESMLLSGNTSSAFYTVVSRNLDIPIPSISSLTLCCNNSVVLSPVGDSLIIAQYSIPLFSGLTTTATFTGGSTMGVTTDNRTTYEMVDNTCGAVMVGHVIRSVAGRGTLSIRATYRGFTSAPVFYRCVVTIGSRPSLVLLGMSPPPPPPPEVAVLMRVNCAQDLFQSGRARAFLVTSEGQLVPIDNAHVIFTTSAPGILRRSYGDDGFSGASPGQATLSSALKVYCLAVLDNTHSVYSIITNLTRT